jgi:hypothetical protein
MFRSVIGEGKHRPAGVGVNASYAPPKAAPVQL